MIRLTRRESWTILAILVLFTVGNLVRACRQPYMEFVPSRVKAGEVILDAPEPGATDAN
jgi:hypothetical protein